MLPPFCSLWGYLVASRSTWYTSFWLQIGTSGTWYTSFASVLGLFQPLGLLGILHFGSGLKPPVLGILRLPPKHTFGLSPFWACFSLRGYLVYFVPPGVLGILRFGSVLGLF